MQVDRFLIVLLPLITHCTLRLARILRALYIKTIIKSAGARLEPRSGGGELEASEG